MKANTLYDRLIVKQLDSENTLKSGLVIPENNQEKPNYGKIVKVGTGRLAPNGVVVPMVVKEGFTIMYHKFAGHPIKIDGENYVVIKEDDILVYMEE